MKTTKSIGLVLVLTLVASVFYWLGYHHGSAPVRQRANPVSSLRQIGLTSSGERNDITSFTMTGSVRAPKAQAREP